MHKLIARICCILPLVIIPLLLLGQGEPASSSPPHSFWGCWVVRKLLPTPGISGLSQKQVNDIIGTRLVFSPTCARSGSKAVKSPEYSTDTISDRDFFDLAYVSLSQIGIRGNKVVRIRLTKPELSDLEFRGNNVFLRKGDLVIEVENDFFVAERDTKADSAVCRCQESETGK